MDEYNSVAKGDQVLEILVKVRIYCGITRMHVRLGRERTGKEREEVWNEGEGRKEREK